MIRIETIVVETKSCTVMNLCMGVRATRVLDSLIDKILKDAYDDTTNSLLDSDEYTLLMDISSKLGKSEMSEYIR
ncbi:MAG: hypothetical protein K0Q73_5656 [Paenibacillus sp.]|nr:hypothetical protein [Paenibacillus sp.]